LPAHAGRRRADLALLEQLAVGRAPHLAARGLEHDVRRREHDLVGRLADRVDHRPPDRVAQRRRVAGSTCPGLGQHHQPLGAAARVGAAEDRHAALAHAGHGADRLFDFLRVEVAAAADHDVLDAAGDEDLAFDRVGAVAVVEPAALAAAEQARSELRRAPVAAGGRGAAKL
jgi:hypothetical protein